MTTPGRPVRHLGALIIAVGALWGWALAPTASAAASPAASTDASAPGSVSASGRISAGPVHTCGIGVDGAVRCWGDNGYRQSEPPAGTFVAVSVGESFSCGIRTGGVVDCWGYGPDGEDVPPDGTFVALSVGGSHVCGIRTDATLHCWGSGADGHTSPPGGEFTALASSWSHNCAIRVDDTLACWGGTNTYGQSTTTADAVIGIAVGDQFSCALRSDASASCWGRDQSGAATAPPGTFTAIGAQHDSACAIATTGGVSCWGAIAGAAVMPTTTDFEAITVGAGFACGLVGDGSATCWGSDGTGRASPPSRAFTRFSAGSADSRCAIREDQTIRCWGTSLGSAVDEAPPGTFTDVAVGFDHACGVRTDGTIHCWGQDGYGQATPPPGTFVDVTAGRLNSCGIRTNGTVTCWGVDSEQAVPPSGEFTSLAAGGASGLGPISSPYLGRFTCGIRGDQSIACWGFAVAPSGTFTSIAAGNLHACAVRTDGTVLCWGADDEGEGDPPPGTFLTLAGGNEFTCGIRTDHTVVCWGADEYHQASPPSGTFRSIAAGADHACGIRTNGVFQCWGERAALGSPLEGDPPGTVPSSPLGPTATAGDTSATVAWQAPLSDGGAPIDGFTVVSSPGIHTCNWTAGPLTCTVNGLTNGTAYMFTVLATNSVGNSPPSAPTTAIVPRGGPLFHALVPARILDTRPGPDQIGLVGGFGPTQSRVLQVTGHGGVPSGATAVAVNVTAVNPSADSFLSLTPELLAPGQVPTTSNLNLIPGTVRPNLVVVKLDPSGRVTIYNNSGNVDVLADVVGWFDDGTLPGDRLTAVTPTRILDTRPGPEQSGLFSPFTTNQARPLDVAGHGGVPEHATAVVLNVTSVNPSVASFLSLTPDLLAPGAVPSTSNLNLAAGQVRPNLVVVKLDGSGRVSIYNNSGVVHVLADVVGYFSAATGGAVTTLSPARILDTRPGPEETGLTGKFGPTQARILQVTGHGGVPDGAAAVWLNVTSVNPSADSFLSLTPSTLTPGEVPSTSNLNLAAGQAIPNLVLVKLSPTGTVSIYNNSGSVDVLADVVAFQS